MRKSVMNLLETAEGQRRSIIIVIFLPLRVKIPRVKSKVKSKRKAYYHYY